MTSTIRTPVVFPGALLAALTLEAVQASRGTVASPPQENALEYSTQAQVADSEASSLFQGSSTKNSVDSYGVINDLEDAFASLDDSYDQNLQSGKEQISKKTEPVSVLLAAALGVCFSAVAAHFIPQMLQTIINQSSANENMSIQESCNYPEATEIPSGKAMQALQAGARDYLLELLDAGANPHEEDSWGSTLLHAAAAHGSTEVAHTLLQHDAKVNAADAWQDTPLHTAARSCNADVCKLLVEWKAEVNATNLDDHTPLFVAAKSNAKEVCSYLLNTDAHVGQVGEHELPPWFTSLLLQRVVLGCPAAEGSL